MTCQDGRLFLCCETYICLDIVEGHILPTDGSEGQTLTPLPSEAKIVGTRRGVTGHGHDEGDG